MFKRFFLFTTIMAFALINALEEHSILWEREAKQEEAFVQDVMQNVPPQEDDDRDEDDDRERVGRGVVGLLVEYRGGPVEVEEIDLTANSRIYNFFMALLDAGDAFIRQIELEHD